MVSRDGLPEAISNSECHKTHVAINAQYTLKRSDSASRYGLTPSGTQHNPRSRTEVPVTSPQCPQITLILSGYRSLHRSQIAAQ
jgi:hypothetical protein